MEHIKRLSELAAEYRALAARAANPKVGEELRRAAAFLESEAAHAESAFWGVVVPELSRRREAN